MLGRNGNIAYVRYDHQGRIVPGGPIISAKPPRVGNWQAVSNVLGSNTTGTNGNVLRAFIRVDYFNRVVPSSLLLLTKEPGDNNSQTTWVEINAQYRGNGITTTTTTTTILPICNYSGGDATFEGYYPTTSSSTTLATYTIKVYAKHNGGPGKIMRLYYSFSPGNFTNYVEVNESSQLVLTVSQPSTSRLYMLPKDELVQPVGASASYECYIPYSAPDFSCNVIQPPFNLGNQELYISLNDESPC